jgi:hypothetical protein
MRWPWIFPPLVMTNDHVLDSVSQVGKAVVEFNCQFGLNAPELPTVRFRLRPDVFVTTSP